MARFADRADFTVRWLPFQLNPGASRVGMDKMQYYNDKFGPGKVAQIIPRMQQVFAEEGMTYSLGGLTGSTLDSHRLIAWSEQFGPEAQNKLVEELFLDYFTREKYIGDREVLLAAVVRAGLPADAAAAVLDDPAALAAEVQQLMARGRGVGGVPYFVVQNSFKMSGAQPSELFEEIFDQICGSA